MSSNKVVFSLSLSSSSSSLDKQIISHSVIKVGFVIFVATSFLVV
jgi:hypothetical protein